MLAGVGHRLMAGEALNAKSQTANRKGLQTHTRALMAVQAALATLMGTLASYAYLRWLMHDMAGLSQGSVTPFQQARAQQSQPAQTLLLGLAAYRQALLL